MELTGKIILDDETISALRNEIRAEILEEIKKDGLYYSEIANYLSNLEFESYYNMLAGTLPDVIEKTDESTFHWNSQEQKHNRLKIIHQMLRLRDV